MKKIAFHSNQLGLRGTEVAVYAYAKYNEEILGNKSVIFSHPWADMSTLQKFKDRFEVVLTDWGSYEKYLIDNQFDFLYVIKMGTNDGYCLSTIPTIVHAVFRFNDPHGHKYVYVSDWLCKDQGYDPETHSLPHICEKLPPPKYDFREKMGISNDVKVFGCYAGATEFNIGFVRDAIKNTVESRSDIEFIFLNVEKFIDHPQVRFFPGTYDLHEKSAFVEACDAMIHARNSGETFGLAVSEFALANKPIITYGSSGERSHIEILGERGIYYYGYEDVVDILNNLDKYVEYNDYYTPYLQFSPEIVMNKFSKIIS